MGTPPRSDASREGGAGSAEGPTRDQRKTVGTTQSVDEGLQRTRAGGLLISPSPPKFVEILLAKFHWAVDTLGVLIGCWAGNLYFLGVHPVTLTA